MCRWLAYSGPSIALEDLLVKPMKSLIRQSLSSNQGVVTTNGDGFGVGWYGDRSFPGIFRDTLPAWNDSNLLSLSEQIKAKLFFAHVRASTGTSTSRENCHPFRYENMLFMHNGMIGGFREIRREYEQLIDAEYYRHRLGTTDTEAFFLLALSNGLAEDVPLALRKTVRQTLALMEASGSDEPFHMTAAVSNGDAMYVVRYSNDDRSPSLYYAVSGGVEIKDQTVHFSEGDCATLVLSEPLDERHGEWMAIEERQILFARGGMTSVENFAL
jgi:predicted glutamine amidotransferase